MTVNGYEYSIYNGDLRTGNIEPNPSWTTNHVEGVIAYYIEAWR